MDVRSAPLLPAAGAFTAGAALAFRSTQADSPLQLLLLFLLLAVPLLLRRRAGVLVSLFALGALWTTVREDLPTGASPGWDPRRPVIVEVETSEPWRRTEWGGWTAAARPARWRQGTKVRRPHLEVRVTLPELPETVDELPPPGSRLRLTGYLRRFAGFANARPVAPGPWRLSVKSWRHVEVPAGPGPLGRVSHRLRRRLEAALEELGNGHPGAALARALVLGDDAELPPRVVRGLRRSGLGHLLALSGLHLGLVAGFTWLAGGPLPRGPRLLGVLAATVLYLLVAGPRPSLLRAAVMVAAAVAALAAQRPPGPANALGLAVLGLVAQRPSVVQQLGFQLTVAATAGILVLAPRLAARWGGGADPGRTAWLRSALAVTVAAQLATLPWVLPAFHGFSPLAPLVNLAAVPWTAVFLAAALVWLGLALAAPGPAAALLPGLDALAAPFAWPAAAPAGPWWFLPWELGPSSALLATALLIGLLGVPRPRTRRAGMVLAIGAGVGLAVITGLADRGPWGSRGDLAEGPRLSLLDVGQGEAILLRDGGRALLVDGGGWKGAGGLGGRVLLPALLGEGVRRLDAVAMTHPDVDHCGGLVEIGSYLPVAEIWTPPGWDDNPCAAELRRTPGARVRELTAGARGRLGRWRWWVLHPGEEDTAGRNERSLVLLVQAWPDGPRVLLTGDLDGATEARLAARLPGRLAARVLKVAHHGSRSSSTSRFLAAVAPRLALVSAGRENLYGHPAPETVDRLRRRGTRILRTDRDGLVRLTFAAGGGVRIELPGSPR